MTKRVLIIGGYGNFGSTIARALAADANIRPLIGGRSRAKAERFAAELGAEAVALDIHVDITATIAQASPDIVIHTTGPFQGQSTAVARACIAQACHYIDLADARDFVAAIGALDREAKDKGVAVISGASSVPCLTAAVIDRYLPLFAKLETVDYGISATQHTNRGLATTQAILSFVGKPFTTLSGGEMKQVFGFQDLHSKTYPELGRRWFGRCDIPDLALFPKRYPSLQTMRFSAGHEIALLHFGLWLLSWPVRAGLLPSLDRYAAALLRASIRFEGLGQGRSGFHMFLTGTGRDGKPRTVRFFIIARQGHGPNIPCMPAIILAQRLVRGEAIAPGARPCLDLIDLDEYMTALRGFDISVIVEGADG
jgi:saccharopine dehydrogenase-like NADP-dependent oxidoreductase